MSASSPMARRSYLEKQKGSIEAALSAVMGEVLRASPPDPVQFLAEQLLKARAQAEHKNKQGSSQNASCMLDHNAKLDIYSPPADLRSTGIICTIGPNTEAPEKLTLLRTKGLNVMRMNFSHGSYEEHGVRVTNLRKSVADNPLDGRTVAIALDTKGPEIRTGTLKDASAGDPTLTAGSMVTVTVDPAMKCECTAELIYMDYTNLPKVVQVDNLIYIDDGLLSLKVVEIPDAQTLKCEVMNTAKLGSHKGCNLPLVDVDLPALSEKDKKDLAFGIEQNVDMVFASFIRKASDVREVRACLVAADPVIGKRIRIISKIENHEGMRNFDEILAETDGVMVARGDLGIEIPAEKVFLAQKMMIAKCNVVGKPVICATQMLESMTTNPRPTRAEVSDVANAVLDGADCVMLSGETAKGKYPAEAVSMMAEVCREAESALFQRQLMNDMTLSLKTPLNFNDSVAKAVVDAAASSEAALVVTLTGSGNSARLISRFRPTCPILVLSRDPHIAAACNLHRGCLPFHYPHARPEEQDDREDRFAYAVKLAIKLGLVKPSSAVVLTHGVRSSMSLTTFRVTTVLEDGTIPRELPGVTSGGYDANSVAAGAEPSEAGPAPLPPFVRVRERSDRQTLAQEASCMLDHNTKLDIYSPPADLRSTGIICTIGPNTEAPEKLTLLRTKGLNVMRMNFSHGSYEEHGVRVTNLRKSVADNPLEGRLVAIALDTKGPEIRTGTLKDASAGDPTLTAGSMVTVTVDPAMKCECTAELIYMDYTNLPKVVQVDNLIYIDDGLLSLKVVEIPDAQTLKCEVMNTAKLGSHKGCNLPLVDVDLPALSEKDKKDLAFGIEQNVDMVFASFIRKASDVREVRACLVAADPVIGKRIRIISKIENHEGMRNFDEILAETDGVMVARGDLGIEIPAEKVFLAQKMMIAKCNVVGKPVICATQMLESMTTNPRPTRAEVSDVANAVLDGADCVMLSGETAKGKYPAEAVSMMAEVCREAESALFQRQLMLDMVLSVPTPLNANDAVARALVNAATNAAASLIITLTSKGTSARLISRWRPRCPILVLSRDPHTGAACNLHRGCIPFVYPHPKQEGAGSDAEARFAYAMDVAKKCKLAQVGQTVVLAQGSQSGVSPLTTFRMAVVA